MIIYGIKSCDTCRKAIKAVEAAGGTPQFHDIRADPLDAETLSRFLDTFGDDLVNRRSTTWRNLDEDARSGAPAALLEAHPTLMKRPVIELDDTIHLGWSPAVQAKVLPS